MRLFALSRRGANRVRHLIVRQALVPLALCGAAAAGCSGYSATGPTPNQNIQLMARFDSVLATLDPVTQARRREQLTEVITLLAFGAPVETVQLTVNGTTRSYSGVGGFIVSDDIGGHAVDSAYTLLAWHGDAADTLASVAIFHGSSTFELTDSATHVGSTGAATGIAQAASLHDGCTSYLDHLPPDVSVPGGLSCERQRVTAAASGSTDDHAAPGSGSFALPSQSVSGVRVEGRTGS